MESLFQKYKIKISSRQIYNLYPGYCMQCNLKNGGNYTFFIPLSPNEQIIICNECHSMKKVNEIMKKIQKDTFHDKLEMNKHYTIIDNEIMSPEWIVDPEYKMNLIDLNIIYVPLIRNNEKKFYPLRNLIILNDIKI